MQQELLSSVSLLNGQQARVTSTYLVLVEGPKTRHQTLRKAVGVLANFEEGNCNRPLMWERIVEGFKRSEQPG